MPFEMMCDTQLVYIIYYILCLFYMVAWYYYCSFTIIFYCFLSFFNFKVKHFENVQQQQQTVHDNQCLSINKHGSADKHAIFH